MEDGMSKIRAAAYVRVSTKKQADEGFSLGEQRKQLTELANARGWDCEVFEDPGISGEKLKERPELTRLLAAVDNGKFDVVMVVDESRLARNRYVATEIAER